MKERVFRIKKEIGLINGPLVGRRISFPSDMVFCADPDELRWGSLSMLTLAEKMPDFFEEIIEVDNSKTIQALIECEEHWIVHAYLPLLKGGISGHMGANTCALCTIFNNTLNQADKCEGCPLKEQGIICRQEGSPWNRHDKNQTAQTALDMVEAIRECRKKLEGGK